MDRVQVQCPSCDAILGLPAGRLGSVDCPKCRFTFPADTRSQKPNSADAEWRDRLLLALANTGVQRSPPAKVGSYFNLFLRMLAFFVVIAPLSWAIDSFTDKVSTSPWPLRFDFWFVNSVVILGMLTGALSVPIIRFRRQLRAAGAEQALQRESGRPVFYLRSFAIDELLGRQTLIDYFIRGNFHSDALGPEDQLVKRFSTLGPLIAIGRPGEKLPSLGAARFYVTDEKWQQFVAEIARESQFVIWVSGKTGGLRWELSHLIQNVAPTQLVLWAHPHLLRLSAPKREREWRSFLDLLGNTFPVPLPNRLGQAQLFYFGSTFEPYSVKPNEYALWAPQADALRSLFVAKGLLKMPAWVWRAPNRAIGCLYGLIAGGLIQMALDYNILWRNEGHIIERIYSKSHSDHILLYYFMYDGRNSLIISAMLGAVFVAVQPLWARVRGGYLAGSLMFEAVVQAFLILIFPLFLSARIKYPWVDAGMRGDWLDAIVFLNARAVDGLIWVGSIVVLLRYLPFAPGRPRRPHVSAPSK